MNHSNSKNFPEVLPIRMDNSTVEEFIGNFINGIMKNLNKDVIEKYSEIAPGVAVKKIRLELPNGATMILEDVAAGVTFTP